MKPSLAVLAVAVALAPRLAAADARAPAATLPLVFEANQGQAAAPVRFVAHRPGHDLLLAPGGATVVLDGPRGPRALSIGFDGAAADPRVEGDGALPGRANYLVGSDPARWHTGVPLFARVAYRALYPAIDLVLGPSGDELLEYDFHVAPGGDPARIALRFGGARSLALGAGGELLVDTGDGVLAQHAPIAYQDGPLGRVPVAARFVVRGPDTIGFAVGAYDRARPLVIDPPLAYSTFVGGDGTDHVNAVATDGSGMVYVTGETTSLAGPLATDFATRGPIPGGEQEGGYSLPPPEPRPFPSIRRFDAFVGKLDPSQSGAASLVYLTFLGGDLGDDRAFALAVDGAGRAHVGGLTSSSDLPLANPLQTCRDASNTYVCDFNNAFLARLSASGGALEYGSYLVGHDVDEVAALAIGPGGRLYVGGRSASLAGPSLPVPPASVNYHFYFPITAGGVQPVNHGIFDAFLTVLDLDAPTKAQQLVYSTFLGGCADDAVLDLAVDAAGRAYLHGATQAPCTSLTTRLPIKNAIQPAYAGGLVDAFVAAVDPAAAGDAGLVFATFLGGRNDENDLKRAGLALDDAGDVFVGGTTSSPDFPTTAGAAQRCGGMSASNAATYQCNPTTGLYPGALPPNGVIVDGYLAVFSPAGAGGYATYNASTRPFPITANALQGTQPGSSTLPFDNGFLALVAKPQACAPDLVVRKLADPEPLTLGCGPLTYTIEIANLGVLAATQVVVTDPLAAPETALSATATQGTCTLGATIACSLGTLAPGAHATITIVAGVDPAYAPTQPPLVNTATATALEVDADADAADNASSWTTHVVAGADADGDGALDCVDACPDDPAKAQPGLCGCGAEDLPAAALSSPIVVEGDDGTTTAWFELTLAHPTCVDLAFAFATAPGADPAATPAEDYLDTAGSLAIAAGDVAALIPVTIAGDTVVASLTCDPAGGGTSLHLSSGSHKLKLEQVTSVACTDSPGVDPGLPAMGFDTLTGTGVGRWDGVPGHLVSFRLVDAGEPGTADRVTITIATAQGVTVKTIDAALVQGNLDAQP